MCLVGLFLSVIASLIPTAIYAWFVNWLDRHEKEPWWLLVTAFWWGAIPAFILAVVAQLMLDIPTTWVLPGDSLASELVGGSVWAPITEEVAKGMGILLILLLARQEVDGILDGIVYGAMAGLGFAFTENVLYFGSALMEDSWGGWAFVVLLRTIPFGLNHAFFTGLTGAGIGAAYLSRKRALRFAAPTGGLVAGMFFHGIHNLGAALSGASFAAICVSFSFDWGGILMLGVLIIMVWRQEKRWIREQLQDEVTQEVYQLLTFGPRWRRTYRQAVLSADKTRWRQLKQLRRAATELAFKKHQLAHRGPDPKIDQDIQRYRQRLAKLNVASQPTNQPSNHPTT